MTHEAINTVLLSLVVVLLLWIVLRSRDWQGPAQAVRLDDHDKRISILSGNLSRLSTEHTEFRREGLESNHHIWTELRAINARLDSMKCPLSSPDCPMSMLSVSAVKE